MLRPGTNPIWGATALIWLFGWLALDFYWLFTESGLIRIVASWEASATGGSWSPKITLFIILLAQISLMVLIKRVVEKITGKRLTQPVR